MKSSFFVRRRKEEMKEAKTNNHTKHDNKATLDEEKKVR